MADAAEVWRRMCRTMGGMPQFATEGGRVVPLKFNSNTPDDIRALGWAVAIHNDYHLGGVAHTFWLVTHGTRSLKGEGRSDVDALNQIRQQIERFFPTDGFPRSFLMTPEYVSVTRDAERGDVWYWQGDGYDFPASLTCPVIMSADALRGLLARIPQPRAGGTCQCWVDGRQCGAATDHPDNPNCPEHDATDEA